MQGAVVQAVGRALIPERLAVRAVQEAAARLVMQAIILGLRALLTQAVAVGAERGLTIQLPQVAVLADLAL
jgi:hypothetical protein